MKLHPRISNTGVISVKIELSEYRDGEEKLVWSLYAADAINGETAWSGQHLSFGQALDDLIDTFDKISGNTIKKLSNVLVELVEL